MATKFKNWMPAGVIPAALLPFDTDFSIDVASFKQHISDLAARRWDFRHHHQCALD